MQRLIKSAQVLATIILGFSVSTLALAQEPDPDWGTRTLRQLRSEAKAAPSVATLVNYAFTPNVIPDSATGNVRLSVRMTGPLPSKVQLASQWGVTYDLIDAGASGDLVAGDGVYSTLIPVSQILSRRVANDIYRVFVGFVDVYEGATRNARYNALAQVRGNELPGIAVRSLSSTVQVSPNVLNLSVPSLYRTHDVATPSITDITKLAFTVLPDQYDFLNIVFDRAQVENRYHYAAYNATTGIGIPTFDQRLAHGSSGKLLGVSVFPGATFFDGASTGFIHETGHQWVSFLKNASLTSGTPHWSTSTMASGVMGHSIPGSGAGGSFGCGLTPEGTGLRTKALPNDRVQTYNPLDLYLMGLVAVDEVPDQWVVTDSNFGTNWQTLCDGRLLTTGLERLTINDVIAVNGPRSPAFANSQRTFRMATIVVSDGLLSADAMSFYDYFAKRMELREQVLARDGLAVNQSVPFFVATNGRGALVATVDPALAVPTKVAAVEYFNAQLNYYFLTSRANEQALLSSAPGWATTGQSFQMLANPAPELSGNVRFYFDQIAKNGTRGSHFYSLNPSDIATLRALNPTNARVAKLPIDEGVDSFAYRPIGSGLNALCAAGTLPVYRLFRGGVRFPDDPNHRFTTSKTIYDQFVAAGWDGEGVNFCVPAS